MKFLQKRKKEQEGSYSCTNNYWFLLFFSSIILILPMLISIPQLMFGFISLSLEVPLTQNDFICFLFLPWSAVPHAWCPMHVTYYSFGFLLLLNPVLSGSAFLQLTMSELFIVVGSLMPSLCLISSWSCTCISLYPGLYPLSLLLKDSKQACISLTCHCASCKILQSSQTVCKGYQFKTLVVLSEKKEGKNKRNQISLRQPVNQRNCYCS